MTDLLSLSAGGWHCHGGQILGDREEQQDDLAAATAMIDGEKGLILVLADGMGGHRGGALAARLAVEGAMRGFLTSQGEVPGRLLHALEQANAKIAAAKSKTPALAGMGCTLVLAALAGERLWYLSVGDSLLLHAEDWRVWRLNEDHSLSPMVDALVRQGDLTPAQGARDPRRHQLRSALTGEPIAMVDAPAEPIRIPDRGRVVLASDGLAAAPHEAVSAILSNQEAPKVQAEALLAAARTGKTDHLDNTSLIVCARDTSQS